MTAEYTPLAVLRGSARQLWGALNEDGSRDPASAARALQPNAQAHTAPTVSPRRVAPPSAVDRPVVHNPVILQVARLSEETCSCYKCGVYGHIGSNPICPKYKDSPVALGARVGAQRVPNSYSDADESHAGDDLLAAPEEDTGAAEDFDGLWGGAQYDPEADPNEAPDLAELLHDARNDEGESADTSDTPEEAIPASAATLDCNLPPQFCHPAPGWMSTERPQEPNAVLAASPTSLPGYDGRLTEFKSRVGQEVLSIAQTLELEAISAIGAEEHARTIWLAMIPLRPAVRVNYSPELLRTTAVNLTAESLLFTCELDGFQVYQQDLVGLLARRLEAHDEITCLAALPSSASSLVGDHLTLPAALNHRLSADIHHHLQHVDYWVSWISNSQRIVNAEVLRRMLTRETYALERIQSTSSSLSWRALGNFPVAADADDVAPSSSTVVAAVMEPPAPPPPHSPGSTPPPSYPGTPESPAGSATSDDLWEVQDDPSAVLATTLFLPGDEPVMISDSEDESPLSLHANQIVLVEANCALTIAVDGPVRDGTLDAHDALDLQVPDTYSDDDEVALGIHNVDPSRTPDSSPAIDVDEREDALDLQVPDPYSDDDEVALGIDGVNPSSPESANSGLVNDDDAPSVPKCRIQVLAQPVAPTPRVEHISNVRCPEKIVGLNGLYWILDGLCLVQHRE
ncbi:hypothetical protein DFH06DRAFT_1348026 [Mycena polygramma]|nr:hypothetical protein DFH06DRAFT_1348026 [Mycena polygramma]